MTSSGRSSKLLRNNKNYYNLNSRNSVFREFFITLLFIGVTSNSGEELMEHALPVTLFFFIVWVIVMNLPYWKTVDKRK